MKAYGLFWLGVKSIVVRQWMGDTCSRPATFYEAINDFERHLSETATFVRGGSNNAKGYLAPTVISTKALRQRAKRLIERMERKTQQLGELQEYERI